MAVKLNNLGYRAVIDGLARQHMRIEVPDIDQRIKLVEHLDGLEGNANLGALALGGKIGVQGTPVHQEIPLAGAQEDARDARFAPARAIELDPRRNDRPRRLDRPRCLDGLRRLWGQFRLRGCAFRLRGCVF